MRRLLRKSVRNISVRWKPLCGAVLLLMSGCAARPETESHGQPPVSSETAENTPKSINPTQTPSPSISPSAAPPPSEKPVSRKKTPDVTVQPDMIKSGSFETEIVDYSKNRIKNIKLVIKKLNGTIIKSGEEFSFNKAVGPRTMKKGYKEAIIFINGEKVKEVGGGICQVSSTIYQAALDAGFNITERHQHQREVYYVKLGDDATVYYGQLDLKFINTAARDMKLICWIGEGKVGVSLEPVNVLTEQ